MFRPALGSLRIVRNYATAVKSTGLKSPAKSVAKSAARPVAKASTISKAKETPSVAKSKAAAALPEVPSDATTAAASPVAATAAKSSLDPLDDETAWKDLTDVPRELEDGAHDWSRSYHGLGSAAFSKEAADVLLAPLEPDDVEIKPDGLIYLPEIKYRRVLNKAFGPGGWGLVPRGETIVTPTNVTREYGLVCEGRLVGVARGEQQYFGPAGIATATEGCKSNAMMRCCKDLGIASELWDPKFIRRFKKKYCEEVFVEHITTKRKRKIWKLKEEDVAPPYKKA